MDVIKPFDPWKSKLCTCPEKYSVSAYTGCGHGCLYCYASSYIRDFYHPRPKRDFIARLKKDLRKIPPGSLLTMANSSDPYLPLEEVHGLTRQSLELLSTFNVSIMLVTKSARILKDIDIIRHFEKIEHQYDVDRVLLPTGHARRNRTRYDCWHCWAVL